MNSIREHQAFLTRRQFFGRTAAYTGREVTWDELMKTKEVWDPKIDLNKLR